MSIKIYEISVRACGTIDAESGKVLKVGKELEESDFDSEFYSEDLGFTFHVGAEELTDAYLEASEVLDGEIGEGRYEICSVSQLPEIKIINWPGDGEDCECPWCRTERAAKEDLMEFKCSCGNDIKIVENGWEEIRCPGCKRSIFRNNIIGSNGNYILVVVGDENNE